MNSFIFIVDDDHAMRDSLETLFRARGYDCEGYDSGAAYLESLPAVRSGCVLIDINMPGMSGLELVEKLKARDFKLPCIMMTGFGQVSTAVKAMKLGAFDFIEKPFEDNVLMDTVTKALAHSNASMEADETSQQIVAQVEKLTPRERDVFEHLVRGSPNKIIAHKLGISARTVEVHRARVMAKLGTHSVADVVRMAIAAGISKVQ